MPKFEAHITLPREYSDRVEKVGELLGWKFSAIDGDPLMGKRPYCYLTHYDTNKHRLLRGMIKVGVLLESEHIEVLRNKVERIIFDSRTGVDEITNV